ncbi:MAG TPA: hypothetical protein ENN90_07565 [Mariniphaga anaerophila]|uniref:Uncharacterized protein n=1 Tax=Mariniphaga anaerophila TaxID=1484053 RepID=A0A831LH74_9BACT|nr:hypothetical protein [Mariniphaga anaerophila]
MKTMKARLNQIILVALFTVIFMSVNVNANGTETIVVSGLENIAEPKLQIEDWMVNETCWLKAEKASLIEMENDERLMLEAWMVDETRWQMPVFENFSSMEAEQGLKLEYWMVNEMYWN